MTPHRLFPALALLAAAPAQAALITATFSGTVVGAYDRLNNLGFNALLGQAISATLSLDTALAPAATLLSPGTASYRQPTPWYSLGLQAGGKTLSADGYATPYTDSDGYGLYVSDIDASYFDNVQFLANHGGGSGCWNTATSYGCADSSGAMVNLVAKLPGQLAGIGLEQLADSLSSSQGSAFYWEGAKSYSCTKHPDGWGYITATCQDNYRSDGWLSIAFDQVRFGAPVAAVPLPGSAPLVAGGLALLAWSRRRRA